jgi:hypothetical protein
LGRRNLRRFRRLSHQKSDNGRLLDLYTYLTR